MSSKANRRRVRLEARKQKTQAEPTVVETVTARMAEAERALHQRASGILTTPRPEGTAPSFPDFAPFASFPTYSPTPQPAPRRFKKARTFHMDGGFEVTIAGEEDSVETEIYVEHESDRTTIYTGDAAIERRIAKQQGGAQHSAPAHPYAPPQTHYPYSVALPPEAAGAVRVPGVAYDGIGPSPISRRRREVDAQDAALAEVGTSMSDLALAMGQPALLGPEEET